MFKQLRTSFIRLGCAAVVACFATSAFAETYYYLTFSPPQGQYSYLYGGLQTWGPKTLSQALELVKYYQSAGWTYTYRTTSVGPSSNQATGQVVPATPKPIQYDNVFGYRVPTTFRGNGASVPMLRDRFGRLLSMETRAYLNYMYPSAFRLHDYLYDRQSSKDYPYMTRLQADQTLLAHLKALGASDAVAYTVYYSVQNFGDSHYKR